MPEIEIPDYEIVREIGRGGMGVVYLARQLSLGRHVAVKVMSTASVDASNVARFLREVRLCVALSHPHVVKLLDGGTTDDWAYLAMEYLDGQDLDGWLFDHGPLRAHQLLQGMEELADALDFVHSQEIVHRDIKSANVIVAKVGGLRLMDFGLARAVESTVLTREGHAVGSPRYLAPETFTRGIMDRLTDLYSLGLVFYEMATATRPFDATTSLKDLAQRIIHGDLPPPSQHEREIPKEIDRLVLKLLSTDRAGRFQTSRELLEAIRVLRSSDSFFGTSWETSRPALNLLSDQPAVTAEPTREPRAGPPGPAEAGTRSGRHRRTTRRQPVTPQPPRRVGLGTLVAMVAAAGLLVGLILRAVVGGAPKLVQPSPEANLRLSVARRFADSASRIDLARLVKELETQHGGRATPRYSSKNLTPERLAATRQKMTAILARQSFHGPYLDLVARGGRTLLDGTLPDSLRMSIYEGLLTLSHLDHFLVHFCGL
ncbi:MAG: serine/threonine protein kinase, partial [Candidatus Riflebacteria bacterium]|nr:serine/threonine protein kinase [Candidatus Riflebacteria bacterium]